MASHEDLPAEDATTEERRQSKRLDHASQIRVTIETREVSGDSANLSPTDVLFYSDESLVVTVEIEEDGVIKRVPGHVVRLDRDEGGRAGWAIEFGK